jgi:predicted N-acetyltransferase YhbS
MGLVDLRRRADDLEVQALASSVQHETAELPRLLVGWSEDGRLVGGIGIDRVGDREIALTNLVVLSDFRLQGIGRSLVEAVVAGAPVERFRATCGPDAGGFFERCGFVPVGAGSYVRDVAAAPAPLEAVAAVSLADLEDAIRAAWSHETSADPDEWTAANPSRGQCDATAALVRAYLGGEILVADVVRDGQRVERHAWNRLPSGLSLDLTRDQFRPGEQLGVPAAQELPMLGDAAGRHALLAERVAAFLARAR